VSKTALKFYHAIAIMGVRAVVQPHVKLRFWGAYALKLTLDPERLLRYPCFVNLGEANPCKPFAALIFRFWL
jgi:hypothetical protein